MAFARDPGNVIPIMTSNTSPSGIASASGGFNIWQAWRAFNNSLNAVDGDGWILSGSTGWISYEFDVGVIITSYNLYSEVGYPSREPTAWTFEGWNGSVWVVLDTRSGITSWSETEKKSFSFANTTTYKKYRLNVSASKSVYLSLGEFEMIGIISTSTATQQNQCMTGGM